MTPGTHILGVPVEELALALVSSGGAPWLVALTTLRRRSDHDEGEDR